MAGPSRLGLGLIAVLLAFGGGSSEAAPRAKEAILVESFLTNEIGAPRPVGLAYAKKGKQFFVARSDRTRTSLIGLSPPGKTRRTVGLPKLARPWTLSFDPVRKRFTAVSPKRLVTIPLRSAVADSSSVRRFDIGYLGLRSPQASTFDPRGGKLLILDSAAQQIVSVTPGQRPGTTPVRISLRKLGARTLRGLAYNSADRLVYVASIDKKLLYGLDGRGVPRKRYSLRSAAVRNLNGLLFAPSSDRTDPPSHQHLFVADQGSPKALGRIVEIDLNPPPSLRPTVTGQLVQTIRTSRFRPPSPDPSGIAYSAATDTLLIADSEVDEMAIYKGVNLFWMNRKGELVETGTTLGFSNEPSGLALGTGSTLYVSDDNTKSVFIVQPGQDGRHGTKDDVVARMRTKAFGSLDPEDVEFDPRSGHLFVADGTSAEIYDVDPVNGVFGDGDDSVTRFDVGTHGVQNIEGLGSERGRGTLLVVADRERKILEITRTGGLVRVISLATIPGAKWLAAIAMAPTSNPNDDPKAMSYWITDRQLDNDRRPRENDGRVYEVVLP